MNRTSFYPESSIQRFIKLQEQHQHNNKLRIMEPYLRFEAPPTYSHILIKRKKERMLEERFTEIERHNQLLLVKMLDYNKKRNRSLTIQKNPICLERSRIKQFAEISAKNFVLA